MTSKIYDVVQGINQAAANARKGAVKDGEVFPREDLPVAGDKNEGFSVKFQDRNMILKYHGEVPLEEVGGKDFKGDLNQKMEDIVKFIRKEYRSLTGNSVSLKLTKKEDPFVQSLSRTRSWVQMQRVYEIGDIKDVDTTNEGSATMEEIVKKWYEGKKFPYDK